MKNQRLRALASRLAHTPLHPQWFALRQKRQTQVDLARRVRGRVLDIGCASKEILPMLDPGVQYTGLDYPATAIERYHCLPDVFADAKALPFPDRSYDWILLLDVLEHLEEPVACLNEIHRVLVPGGQLALQVPFLYPLHDEPFDFRRWTTYGLQKLAAQHEFEIVEKQSAGPPLETAALLCNIAFSQTVLNWFERKHPLSIAAVLLPPVVLLNNIGASLLSWMAVDDQFMPAGYWFLLRKEKS
jgi:SAM-dependent methyltransferase